MNHRMSQKGGGAFTFPTTKVDLGKKKTRNWDRGVSYKSGQRIRKPEGSNTDVTKSHDEYEEHVDSGASRAKARDEASRGAF